MTHLFPVNCLEFKEVEIEDKGFVIVKMTESRIIKCGDRIIYQNRMEDGIFTGEELIKEVYKTVEGMGLRPGYIALGLRGLDN